MKKEINSSMKKAFYGLDWTICFLWAIGVVVVGYGWFPYFPVNLVALMVLFRIVCSFALYKGEKKAWASGLVALALMALKWLMDADVHVWILTSKAYAMMGMETDKPREEVFPWVLKVWLGLFPVVAYAVNAMRKGRYGGQLDVEGSDGAVALDGPTSQDLLRPAIGGALCLVFRAGPLRPCLRLGLCCGAHGQSLSAAKAPWRGDGETVGGGHCHGPVLLVAV